MCAAAKAPLGVGRARGKISEKRTKRQKVLLTSLCCFWYEGIVLDFMRVG